MIERQWKLGEDLSTYDNILDAITFDEVIMTVHCNCRNITREAVQREFKNILEIRMQDMKYLLNDNIDEIIAKAKEGRN